MPSRVSSPTAWLAARTLSHSPEERIDNAIVRSLSDAAWQTYTILCPLYRETEVVPQFVAFTFYRWDINVRMATVIGIVGGGGIGFILKDYIDLLQWPQAGNAIFLIAATVIVMDYASALIRERLQ